MATRLSPSSSKQLRSLARQNGTKSSNKFTEFLGLLALPPVFIFYSFLLPPEVEFFLGSMRLNAYRIALYASIPWIIIGLINGRFKPHVIDILILISALWPIFAWIHHKDWIGGIQSGGAITADIILAWFIGRIAFADPHMLGKILRAILPAIIFIACIFFLESTGGRLFYRETFQSILGATAEQGGSLSYQTRLGLTRSYGPFVHPIHAGIILACFAPFYLARMNKYWKSFIGVFASLAAIFTMSSGAIIALVLGIIFHVYQYLQLIVEELSWKLFAIAILILLMFLEIFSQNGVLSIIVRYFAFGSSGSYRLFIWEYCWIEIQNFPLYGIGSRPWNRPLWLGNTPTIDAHFLALATTMGVIAALPLLVGAIWVNIKLFSVGGKHVDRYSATTVISLAIVITIFNIVSFTVAFWHVIVIWYLLLLGAGLTVVQMQSRRKLPHV